MEATAAFGASRTFDLRVTFAFVADALALSDGVLGAVPQAVRAKAEMKQTSRIERMARNLDPKLA